MKGNIIFYLLFLLFTISLGGTVKAQERVHLFPDKSFAVSGDTLWFSIFIYAENQAEMSQVVHVQLNDLDKNPILKVSVLCKGNFGEGYLVVPDSLSSGLYSLNPFTLVKQNSESSEINQKFLNVYNRFDETIRLIQKPDETTLNQYVSENEVSIKTDKETYKRGENVQVSYSVPQSELENYSQIIATAGLADPASESFFSSSLKIKTINAQESPISLVEKNGILISGKVFKNESGQPVTNAIVLLSIPDSIPFFDYCVSDEKGMFYFYLRNAVGTADLILQAVTKDNMDCRIELADNYIQVGNTGTTEKILSRQEEIFAEGVLQASYYNKLFRGYNIVSDDYFDKPLQFKYTFYGEPTKSFDPNEFIDLPNFQEVSREILRGVQYRERKDETTIRLLDNGASSIFRKEPLRLLDGIPVFDNNVFKPMGTAEIRKVDVVLYERYYGDLSFNGILSVYTKNRSLDWVDRDPKIGHFKFDCIQPTKEYEFKNGKVPNTNVPNLNKVLYRSSVANIKPDNEFDFYTSDIKGDVEIRLVLIDKNNQIKYCHKLIKVE